MIFQDPEAQAWKIGTNVIERAIRPTHKCYFCVGFCIDVAAKYNLVWLCDAEGDCEILPYYHSGDKVAVKETWENVNKPGIPPEYVYKSDYDDAELSECKNDGGKWHSPVTMPSQAVRHYDTIISVEAIERDGQWYWKITMEAES